VKFLILNGPNLNLLGTREPEIYGRQSFEDYFTALKAQFPDHDLHYFQSNVEGEIINALQQSVGVYSGIILNAGGYTHTSVAIADAVAAIPVPVVEVHLSNTQSREPFRQLSLLAPRVMGSILGFGLKGYALGIYALL